MAWAVLPTLPVNRRPKHGEGRRRERSGTRGPYSARELEVRGQPSVFHHRNPTMELVGTRSEHHGGGRLLDRPLPSLAELDGIRQAHAFRCTSTQRSKGRADPGKSCRRTPDPCDRFAVGLAAVGYRHAPRRAGWRNPASLRHQSDAGYRHETDHAQRRLGGGNSSRTRVRTVHRCVEERHSNVYTAAEAAPA